MGTTSPVYSISAARRPARHHWRPWRGVWRRVSSRDGRQPAGRDGGNGRNGCSILRSTRKATTSSTEPGGAANGLWTAPHSERSPRPPSRSLAYEGNRECPAEFLYAI